MGLDAFSTRCEAVAAQLTIQLDGLDLALVRALPHYKYVLLDQRTGDAAREVTVRCLPDTWSLYEQRLFRAAGQVEMLIVQAHNAVSPIPVLCLEDGHYYKAGAAPTTIRPNVTRRNAQEQRLVVSMLALGLEAGDAALAAMSEKSRKRYRALLAHCLKPRRGRARSL